MRADSRSALTRLLLLYAFMYAAFGVTSPFLPVFFQSRGLSPEQIGVVVASGTAVRLVSGPVASRIADLLHDLRGVLAVCAALAAMMTLALLSAHGFWLLLVVAVGQGAALAPLTTLADAIAIRAASTSEPERHGFEYGWVRGAASLAFVLGLLVAGQVVPVAGLSSILWVCAALLAAGAALGASFPPWTRGRSAGAAERSTILGGVRDLLAMPLFRRVVLVAAIVFGSHAMHDTYAVIRWSAAGMSAKAASVLWSESVAAEVIVFFFVGPRIVNRIGPAGAMVISITAGVVRWVVMAESTALVALAIVQPLHGLTFALLHLACLRLLAEIVPHHLAATAQSIYALGAGVTTVALTLLSGRLYAELGARGFVVMAVLCAAALPLTLGLRRLRAPV